MLCWAKLYVAVSYKDYKPYEEHSLRWVTLLPTKYWSKPLSRNKIDPRRQTDSMCWMYILVPLALNQPILHLQEQICHGYRLNQKGSTQTKQSTKKKKADVGTLGITFRFISWQFQMAPNQLQFIQLPALLYCYNLKIRF